MGLYIFLKGEIDVKKIIQDMAEIIAIAGQFSHILPSCVFIFSLISNDFFFIKTFKYAIFSP